jgi:hypothetical protein
VNTKNAAEGSPEEPKHKGGSHAGPRVAASLIVLALVFAGGWWARGLHDSASERAAVKRALDDGVKHVEAALSKQNLEEAEHKLQELKAAAAKDTRIAELQVHLITAKIAKAVSDGQIDHARELLAKAQKDGNVTPEQLQRLQEQVEKAEKAASGSGAASASSSARASTAGAPRPGN